MMSNDEDHSELLIDDAENRLFERFALPMLQPCTTPSQKRSAIGIAKTLWLRFVTETDTEETIYDDLKRVVGSKHDDIIALGSMYFFKMKTALTDAEVGQLKDYYTDGHNFARLEEWGA